ncbi:MAG: hypothetical protein IJU94_03435 [Clostridia bacterium]|nr:hypothetical protein [Clostridia bacterium]
MTETENYEIEKVQAEEAVTVLAEKANVTAEKTETLPVANNALPTSGEGIAAGNDNKKKLLKILIPAACIVIAAVVLVLILVSASAESKALKLMDEGDYAGAKAVLVAADPEDYSRETLAQCNIGLIKDAINKNGTHGKEGKRIYTIVSENTIYFEVNKNDELILGQEFENMLCVDDLKMYIDGSQNVFFERESLIEASLYGRTVKAVDEGNGTVDLSKSSNWVTVDSFNSKMDSTYTGTTTTLGDKNDFTTTTDAQVARTLGAVNALVKQMGLDDITIDTLY